MRHVLASTGTLFALLALVLVLRPAAETPVPDLAPETALESAPAPGGPARLAVDHRVDAPIAGPIDAPAGPVAAKAHRASLPARERYLHAPDHGPMTPAREGRPESIARDYLRRNASRFGLKPSLAGLRLSAVRHGAGSHHVEFDQFDRGLPVLGGYIAVHLTAAGEIVLVDDSTVPVGDVDLVKVVDRPDAIDRAGRAVGETGKLRRAPAADTALAVVEGRTHLVWKVALPASEPLADWEVLVDAASGDVLSRQDRLFGTDGHGAVFDPNPVQSSGRTFADNNDADSADLNNQRRGVVLRDIHPQGYLYGPYVDVLKANGTRTHEPSLRFEYYRSDDRFEEVMCYFHADRAQRHIQAAGFTTANNRRQVYYANYMDENNAFYSGQTKAILMGFRDVDSAEDGDVIVHEYGHAVLDDQRPAIQGAEGLAIHEAFGDYLAATIHDDPKLAEWDFAPYLRRIDQPVHVRTFDPQAPSPHANSGIWSSALWRIRGALDRQIADRIVFQANFYFQQSVTYASAAQAVLVAERNLYAGRHRAQIEAIFVSQGLMAATVADDHGQTTTSATALVLGTPRGGRIEKGGDLDWFAIDLVAGRTYTFETGSLAGGADSVLRLLAADGSRQLAINDDRTTGDRSSRIETTAATSGRHYLEVKDYSATASGGTYEVVARQKAQAPAADDHADGTAGASSLPTDGRAAAGRIEKGGDVDTFVFGARRGLAYVLATSGLAGGMDSVLTLLDGQGRPIQSNDDAGSAASRIQWTATADGNHYLQVRHASPTGTGSYQVAAASQAGDDHGNDPASATTLATGVVESGRIEVAADVDLFRFDVQVGQTIRIETSNLAGGLDTILDLLAGDGQRVLDTNDDHTGRASRIEWTAPASGTHYARVRSYDGASTGSYQVQVVVLSNGQQPAPQSRPGTMPTDGTALAGNIQSGGQYNTILMSVVAGRTYVIETFDLSASMDTVLTLSDAAGSRALASNDDFAGKASRIEWTAPATGDVRLYVTHYDRTTGTGTYRIRVIVR